MGLQAAVIGWAVDIGWSMAMVARWWLPG